MAAYYPAQPAMVPLAPVAPMPEPTKHKNRMIVSVVSSGVLILSYLILLIYVLSLSIEMNALIIFSCFVIFGVESLPLASLCTGYQTWKCLKTVMIVIFSLGMIYYFYAAIYITLFALIFEDVGWTLISDYLGVVFTYITGTFVLFLTSYLPQFCLYNTTMYGYVPMAAPIYAPPVPAYVPGQQPFVGVPVQGYPAAPGPMMSAPAQPVPSAAQDGIDGSKGSAKAV